MKGEGEIGEEEGIWKGQAEGGEPEIGVYIG